MLKKFARPPLPSSDQVGMAAIHWPQAFVPGDTQGNGRRNAHAFAFHTVVQKQQRYQHRGIKQSSEDGVFISREICGWFLFSGIFVLNAGTGQSRMTTGFDRSPQPMNTQRLMFSLNIRKGQGQMGENLGGNDGHKFDFPEFYPTKNEFELTSLPRRLIFMPKSWLTICALWSRNQNVIPPQSLQLQNWNSGASPAGGRITNRAVPNHLERSKFLVV